MAAIQERLSQPQIMRLTLLILTVLGLLLRLWIAWQTNQKLPDTPARLWGDETHYDGLAQGLFEGHFFAWPGRTPIYPLFVAFCYLIFGRSPAAILYVQAFLGAATIPLTFLLARRFTGPWSSLVAAGIIAFNLAMSFQVRRLLTETLYTNLLLLTVLCLLWALEQPVWQRFSGAGALLAITNLCRPTTALFPLIVPLLIPRSWSLKRQIAAFLAFLATTAIVTAPWTYHNYKAHRVFLPYSTSNALLWQGSPEYYHIARKRTTPWVEVWSDVLNPELNGGYDPLSVKGERYFRKRAIDSIKAEPGIYLWYSLQKFAYLWIGNPMVDWPHQAFFNITIMRRFFSPLEIISILTSRLILPFLALSSIFVLRYRLQEFKPLLIICSYFIVIHALTYAEARYSEPLYPIVAVMIAAAGAELQRRLEARSKYC